jgi:hypothetical protein
MGILDWFHKKEVADKAPEVADKVLTPQEEAAKKAQEAETDLLPVLDAPAPTPIKIEVAEVPVVTPPKPPVREYSDGFTSTKNLR